GIVAVIHAADCFPELVLGILVGVDLVLVPGPIARLRDPHRRFLVWIVLLRRWVRAYNHELRRQDVRSLWNARQLDAHQRTAMPHEHFMCRRLAAILGTLDGHSVGAVARPV